MYYEKYKDPENTSEILERIKNSPTLGDIKPILDQLYPNWILGSISGYSKDYPHLQKNWEQICKLSKVKPLEIIIVDFISAGHTGQLLSDGNSYNLIKIFSEILTKSGFCVRSKDEFFPCKKCGLALAADTLYDAMKRNNVPVPSRWSPVCEDC